MIIKANQRKNYRELAKHLLNGEMNEHVTVHDIRGFISTDVMGALREAYAVSKGTQCVQHLFSLSLNPPDYADVSIEDFEAAIDDIEKKLGLIDQPRIIVFHEKHGRRHCHVVWSRILARFMRAINMGHFKYKLQDVSKALFLKHNWKLPKGFVKDEEADSLNYSLQEYQQANRLKEDPKAFKKLLQELWTGSDSKKAFAGALQEIGLYLARGDKRGYVAVDYEGEVYSLTRWLKVKTKDLKTRLGPREELPTVDDARNYLTARLTDTVKDEAKIKKTRARERRKPLVEQLRKLTHTHREARSELKTRQKLRWASEASKRNARHAKGMAGVFEFITGKQARIIKQNTADVRDALKRDQEEIASLVREQLFERQDLEESIRFYKQEEFEARVEIRKDVAKFIKTATEPPKTKLKALKQEIEKLDAKIETISEDITMLQASLDSPLLSDEMRGKIKVLIEKAKEKLRLKFKQDAETKQQAAEQKQSENVQQNFEDFFKCTVQREELKQTYDFYKQRNDYFEKLYTNVHTMSYGLNGVPLYQMRIKTAPKVVFNEPRYVQELKVKEPPALLKKTVHKECKVTEFRQNTLQVKELVRRHMNNTGPKTKPTRKVNVSVKLQL